MKILLVGGGITSAVTGMCLRRMLPGCNLSLWDKAKGSGGRMTTSRCKVNGNCTADLGLQYISTTEEVIESNSDIYNDLLSEGILDPLVCKVIGLKVQDKKVHYVLPNGSGHLVKHFIQKAKLNEMKFQQHVHSINREDEKWRVQTKSGETEYFNIVILTMPIPQLFLLEGTIRDEIKRSAELLNSAKYSARYVLVLFFNQNLKENWGAQYFDSDSVFRYVAIDNVKRNNPESMCAVVFHSTVDFGLKHVEETNSNMESVLLSHAKSMFPNWPEPTSVKCHKWRYSQVVDKYPDSSGCLTMATNPLLLIGGDGFTGSTFDMCVKSAKDMCDKIKETVNLSSSL